MHSNNHHDTDPKKSADCHTTKVGHLALNQLSAAAEVEKVVSGKSCFLKITDKNLKSVRLQQLVDELVCV